MYKTMTSKPLCNEELCEYKRWVCGRMSKRAVYDKRNRVALAMSWGVQVLRECGRLSNGRGLWGDVATDEF